MQTPNPNPITKADLKNAGKQTGKALLLAVGIGYAAWEIWKLSEELRRHLRRLLRS